MKRSIAILKSNLHHLGGLEKYTLRLARQFLKAGCQADIASQPGSMPKTIPAFESISLKHLLE